MSRPRYDWWSYIKAVIRKYPALAREYEDLHTQPVTQAYTGLPGGGGDGRGLESAAIRELPGVRQREYEAVRRAVEVTRARPNGAARLKVVRLVLWERSRTLEGAAMAVPCSIVTAKRWHGDFIKLVAKIYGFLD